MTHTAHSATDRHTRHRRAPARLSLAAMLAGAALFLSACATLITPQGGSVASDPTLPFRTPRSRVVSAAAPQATVAPTQTPIRPRDRQVASALRIIREQPLIEISEEKSPDELTDETMAALLELILNASREQGQTVSSDDLAALFDVILTSLVDRGDLDDDTSSSELSELFAEYLEESDSFEVVDDDAKADPTETPEADAAETPTVGLTLEELLGTPVPTATPTPAPAEGPTPTPTPIVLANLLPVVDIRLLPAEVDAAPGETFTLFAQIEPNGQPVLIAQAMVDFDIFYLEAVSVELSPTSLLQDPLGSDDQFDNDDGTASVAASYIWEDNPPVSTFTLGTFTFRVRNVKFGGTSVDLVPDSSVAVFDGVVLTDELIGATVSIGSP